MSERFRFIDGYVNYQVSNCGRVRNSDSGRILKPFVTRNGYYQVIVCKDGKRNHMYIHRIVAQEFIDNGNDKNYVDHINGDKTNNCVNNLRWVTQSENCGNRKKLADSLSRFKGLDWDGRNNKWRCRIMIKGKRKYLGLFENEKEGARTYNQHAIELFGEYAKLNEISDDEPDDDEEDDEEEDNVNW